MAYEGDGDGEEGFVNTEKNELGDGLRIVYMTIARNVARLRGAMSQEQLAQKAGLSRLTVIAVEQGRAVTLQNLIKLADALGVSPADLFITEEQMERVNYMSIRLFEKLAEQLSKKS